MVVGRLYVQLAVLCHRDLMVCLYITFVKLKKKKRKKRFLSFLLCFKIYLSLVRHQESRGKVLKCAFTYDRD